LPKFSSKNCNKHQVSQTIMKKIISTPNAPKAIGPYSQAVEANGMLFISGQLPINTETAKIDATDISGQTKQVLANIEAILTAAGYTKQQVVKSTIFLDDLSDFKTVNELYSQFYNDEPPARSTVEVSKLPLGALVEIETIAVR